MSNVHIILQGKGGVGKSFIATLFAEYLISKGQKPNCIDCDAINQTFYSFKGLDAHHLEILKDGVINPRSFDDLIELICAEKDGNPFIVDNGSGGFIEVCDYFLSHEVIPMLEEMGHNVFVHTIISGGDNLKDTFQGFVGLASHFPNIQLVVWFNEFFGSLDVSKGKHVRDDELFIEHSKGVFAQIALTKPNSKTFGEDIINLRKKRLTFAEGVKHGKFSIMTRQRLKVLCQGYYSALDQSNL